MKGYQGKVLVVDLSHRTVEENPLDMEDAKQYLGGKGTGDKDAL